MHAILQSVINSVKRQDLIRLEDNILIVVDPQAMLLTSRLSFDIEGIVTLRNGPIFGQTFEKLTRVLTPANVMHRWTTEQIAFNEVGVAKTNPATEHTVDSTPIVAHILVALLCNVCEVDSKAIHVALAPSVRLRTFPTLGAAERSAKALTTGDST